MGRLNRYTGSAGPKRPGNDDGKDHGVGKVWNYFKNID